MMKNQSNQTNQSKTSSQNCQKFNRKRGSSQKTSNMRNQPNNNKHKVQKYKFYFHDQAQRKSSESFIKIKDTIITKIQKSSDDPKELQIASRKKLKRFLMSLS